MKENQIVTVREDIKEFEQNYLGEIFINEEMSQLGGTRHIVEHISPDTTDIPYCRLVGSNFYWSPEMFEETMSKSSK